MDANKLKGAFQTFRDTIMRELENDNPKKHPLEKAKAEMAANLAVAGTVILESALLDLKRSADALETIASNSEHYREQLMNIEMTLRK